MLIIIEANIGIYYVPGTSLNNLLQVSTHFILTKYVHG